MMELIDRYIYEVGRHLPRKNRGDIQAELRSLLLDSLDSDKDETMSEEAVVDVLKEFGSPKEVAASYQPKNQYLIGPELYPLFRLVAMIMIVAVLGAVLLATGVNAVLDPEPLALPQSQEVLEFLGDLFGALMSAFGTLVLTFFILQRLNIRPEFEDEEWDPRSLPPVGESETVNRTEKVIGMAFALVILVILWFFPDIIGVALPWGQGIIINPVIVEYTPLISVVLLLGIGLDLVLLRQRKWTTATRVAKICINLFSIYVLYLLLAGHTTWLIENQASGFFDSIEALSGGEEPAAQAIVMHAFRLAFFIALIVTVVETVGLVFQLIKRVFLPATPITPVSGSSSGN